MERYNHLNSYLKTKFGGRTLKICVDAGMTCPNRDGSKGVSGCLFCSASGSGDHLVRGKSITDQLQDYFDSYKMGRADRFIVYFQSFSNTYGDIRYLREIYLEAINFSDKIVAIQIATRPDCITAEIVELLSELSKIKPIVVELGLQTANEMSATNLNLQYTKADFEKAVSLLANARIEVVAHIMVGLPNESHADIIKTVDFINSQPVKGIKIHSTYVTNNSGLFELYNSGNYSPLELEEYLAELEFILTHLRHDIVIHRVSGDPPKESFVAPEWMLHKKRILNGIDKIMREKNLTQGCFFNIKRTSTNI